MDAHLRRLASTQRQQAVHVLNAYVEMMNAGKEGNAPGPTPKQKGEKVDSGSMWEMMGAPKRKKGTP